VSERNGVFGTTKMSVEIEGSVDKVISVLRRLGSTGGITMSTSFQEEYQALECEFRARVEEDNEYHGAQSVYLPNLAPQRPADFVLVAMEPSTGGGAGDLKKGKAFSPKNFSGSVEDFILHFCIGKYLCGGGRTYHLTDLSKGAMLTRHASDKPEERYLRWYPLLKKELKLVAKPNAPIIAIGNVVHGFLDKHRSLDKQGMPGLTGPILHYSLKAAGAWKKVPGLHPEQYCDFRTTVAWNDVEETVRRVMEENDLQPYIDGTMNRLRRGQQLTASRKKLMFTYKIQFDDILAKAG
jgi:hypothetical protein